MEVSSSESSLFVLLFLWRMLPGAAVWFLAYKARLRGVRIAITVAGLVGIRVAIAVVVATSASATTTVVVSTVSELTVVRLVIRMESSIGKEGGFAIDLLLLLLVRSDGGL
jgi:hypothetical protein